MIIQHAILHILDTNTGNLIASQGEMPVTDIGVHDYIEKLVNKIYAGDVKTGTITGNDYLQTILAEKNFPKMTTELAMKLFEVVTGSDNIQAGDLLSFQATTDDGPIFGMIKLNFSPRYAHAVAYVSEKMVNNLVLNQAVLPAATQTVDEAILINMTTSKYHLIEKKHLIDGHQVAYFSEKFLDIIPDVSIKENLQTIKRTIKNVAEKYDDLPEHEALATTQAAIYEALEAGSIDTEVIAEKVFNDNEPAKSLYREQISKKIVDKEIPVENTKKYEKKYRVQKFKLDSGIEISIPMAIYQDKTKVEFVNQSNGTTSLIIKDIETVLNKFTV
ncbi:nucleoid-associated protein [Leuconostoc gelidum]|uniref:nucleoid-associated protein n=1 Tax=Leuconostoc gelidum TaxID=1244 RepID=UPI001C7DA3D6|nr:nucleoid-associated protein [Leuconostoc gelidum]MBZ6010249.1 nucleoid-associated protein [Leuconostoc gelidum subsp. aenigmaticum]